jgi:hypothetical protein
VSAPNSRIKTDARKLAPLMRPVGPLVLRLSPTARLIPTGLDWRRRAIAKLGSDDLAICRFQTPTTRRIRIYA